MTSALLPSEELLAARDSDSDSGESSVLRASKQLRRPTVSVSGSLGAAATLGGNLGMDILSPLAASSVDPHLKLRIQKNSFVPFEVLVAAEQGKPIRQYLKNPFLTPVNDPKLRVSYPKMTFETWAEGLNIFMLIGRRLIPLMFYLQTIRNMAKVFPSSVWLGYDRKFRILHQYQPSLPWHIVHPQIYFQQLA